MISLNLETDPHHDHDHDHDHYAIDLDKLRHDILNDNNTYENVRFWKFPKSIIKDILNKDHFKSVIP